MRRIAAALLMGSLAGHGAIAQAQQVAANVDPVAPVLRWGTPVQFATIRDLSSKTMMIGQTIDLEVAQPVMVAGRVVIPRGAPALGEVAAVTRRGNWGRRGRMQLRLLFVRVGDQMVRVHGGIGNEGHSGAAGTVAMVAFVNVLGGFLITGTSANIPLGTGLSGYVDEDVPISFGTTPTRTAAVVGANAPAAIPAALTTSR